MGLQEIKDDIFVEYTNESVFHFKYGSIKKYQPLVIIDHHGYDCCVRAVETKEIREKAFQKCLDGIDRLIPQEAIIYFPEMIQGCRLADGNWDSHKKMIEKFAENRNVIIVQQIIWC